MRAALEPARDDDARRQDEQRDEPEPPVEQEEAADRRDQGERVDDERRQPLVEHVRERVDVARQARDDPARLLLGEVPQRERREVLEQVAAELEHDPLADRREHQPGRRAEEPRDDADRDVGDDVVREAAGVAGDDAVVDRVADDVPHRDRGRGRDRGEREHDREAPAPPLRVAPEAREPGAPRLSRGKRLLAEQLGERAAARGSARPAGPPRRSSRRGARPRGRRRAPSRAAGRR